MDRARHVGLAALVFVLVVGSLGAGSASVVPRLPPTWPGRRLEPRRVRGPDRRGLRLGRVRRDREPGSGARRPRRPRDRVRHVVRLDRHAKGDMGDIHARSLPGRRVLIANAAGIFAPGADSRIRAGSPRPAARSRCAWWAVRPSMRSAGVTRRTRSSKGPRRPRRLPARASSGCRWSAGNADDTNVNLSRLVRPGGAVATGTSGGARPARPGLRRRRPPPRRRRRHDPDARRPTATPRRPTPVATRPDARRDPDADAAPTPTPTPVADTHADTGADAAAGRSLDRHRTSLADDATVTIEGVLTVALGGLESGRAGSSRTPAAGSGCTSTPR